MTKVTPPIRYTDEDLAPRDPIADEAALDAWLLRNKDALNASAKKALDEYARGECRTLEEVMAELRAKFHNQDRD